MTWHRIGISLSLSALCALGIIDTSRKTAHAESRYMFLTVSDFEVGISYRQAQWHAPIGQLIIPCSYADHFVPLIDWNDGTGEHKPDTNVEKKMVQTTPAVQSGTYLFWDDEHVSTNVGTQVVTTKLSLHCMGTPPGEQQYIYRNIVATHPRIPVNYVEFSKNGKSVDSVKGHDAVDLTITLDSPAPSSGTWVRLEVTPPGNLNSLPPYIRVSPQETQDTIPNLELRRSTADFEIRVTASTVGQAQGSQKLTVTP